MHKRVVVPPFHLLLSPNNDRPFPSPILLIYSNPIQVQRVVSIPQQRWINNNNRVPESHLNDVATE